MARSKSGGTRSYLRGRIASDVYSIGRDASGKKQQVVRSLAEQVKNPQTIAQMRGRMIMSTIMQAVSGLSPLIDHSFDNVPNGQPSVSEFIRRNYALIKADVAAHPASGNSFGLNKYQEKGVKAGAYLVSSGSVTLPSAVSSTGWESGGIGIGVPTDGTTMGGLKTLLGMGAEDYLTALFVTTEGSVLFYRVNLGSTLQDDVAITSENVKDAFVIDNPFGLNIQFDAIPGELQIMCTDFTPGAGGVILSKNVNSGFEHSTCVLAYNSNPQFNADVALPTYPIGEERFLNGGEL